MHRNGLHYSFFARDSEANIIDELFSDLKVYLLDMKDKLLRYVDSITTMACLASVIVKLTVWFDWLGFLMCCRLHWLLRPIMGFIVWAIDIVHLSWSLPSSMICNRRWFFLLFITTDGLTRIFFIQLFAAVTAFSTSLNWLSLITFYNTFMALTRLLIALNTPTLTRLPL